MQYFFNEQKLDAINFNEIKNNTQKLSYKNYLIESIKYSNSEILVLQTKLSDKDLIGLKYNSLRDYIKEVLKYNYECCLQFQEYFYNKYFNLKQHDLSEFNTKIKSLKQKEVDEIFYLFPDLYPENLIFIVLKEKDNYSILNKLMFTHFINFNIESGCIKLKKFNSIDYEFDLKIGLN
jgi:hypothetical protein